LSASNILRKDHEQIKRLEKVVNKCYHELYAGKSIPFSDIEIICVVISEFLDAIHYSREESSYFPCVASYGTLNKEIRTFLIEHEFGSRIARNISKHLQRWKNGDDAREPVARFLRTYSIYLKDHMAIQLSSVYFLVESLSVYYMLAALISISIAGAINFIINRSWTFGVKF